MPPLYRIDIGKDVEYALDNDELEQILKKVAKNKKPQITRFKGLGEMSAEQLRETTMNPDTRRLAQVIDDGDSRSMMHMLMGKSESPARRAWLEEKGNLAQADI